MNETGFMIAMLSVFGVLVVLVTLACFYGSARCTCCRSRRTSVTRHGLGFTSFVCQQCGHAWTVTTPERAAREKREHPVKWPMGPKNWGK